MSKIQYDPIKDRFARFIRNHRFLRSLFYELLDLFFLRSWYMRKFIKIYGAEFDEKGRWRMLDAGCGFGQYDRFILSHFKNVLVASVDVKEDYLEDCRRYFNNEIQAGRIRFKNADLLNFDETAAYNFTICIDVLEHIEEDRKVIANIYNVLKAGGYFLMHSPSVYSKQDAGDEDSFVGEHARMGYSKQQIREKLESAGFKPVKIEYTYGQKGHFAWKMLIKYPMLWMNRWKFIALPFMAIWYIFTLPFGLILMKLDMHGENKKGTGIYALAQK